MLCFLGIRNAEVGIADESTGYIISGGPQFTVFSCFLCAVLVIRQIFLLVDVRHDAFRGRRLLIQLHSSGWVQGPAAKKGNQL